MTNNKQSSVDFLWNQLPEILKFTVDTETALKLLEAFEQAKEMHNKEVVDFVEDWYCNGPLLGGGVDIEETIHQHYNETFGGTHE
jgi:hypothetical protein